ncbi:MAG: IS1595 family transposase [Gammaproteobacteria bacterium]|nr:IS1595 family transposase [Gammaproteobacteria bacterium]MYD01274.1 IS1595 family transposase [Gammaproteobacteria bacterium]MYI26340.1 IS1595 family transposase [Gammaproteobacteria bacterium]
MTKKAPGKFERKGLTIIDLFRMFPDDEAAEKWFEDQRWPDGHKCCTDCGSMNYAVVANRRPMPYRCRDCRSYFSVKKGTVMQSSKIGLQKWLFAMYMMSTSLKGAASMKVYRELGITQKTAWFLTQRIREGFMKGTKSMVGPVEVDETYVGGKRGNMHASRRKKFEGRGTVGKTAVVGVKDRDSNTVTAKVVRNTDAETLQGFVVDNAEPDAMVYTDDAKAYKGLPNHETVSHSVGEYVREQAHTNGIESFWATMKRGYKGIYHKMSPKHLDRYVKEFAGRHNVRDADTLEQIAVLSGGLVGARLRYKDLIADNGLESGARAITV